MFGAAAMSLSSFFVVTNALRLNLFNIHDASGDKPKKQNENKMSTEAAVDANAETIESETIVNNDENNGGNKMKKTMKIEGMMCMHCEAAVKKALEEIEGVESAEVSHEAGTAIVTAEESVTDEVLKKAVEDKEYVVLEIE